jgi:hypothetical protein
VRNHCLGWTIPYKAAAPARNPVPFQDRNASRFPYRNIEDADGKPSVGFQRRLPERL